MGYDTVKFKLDCPSCGKEAGEFQTKDLQGFFETVDYWECDNFYTSCDWCNDWIEFNRKEKRPQVPIEHFEMTVRPHKVQESRLWRNEQGKIIGYKGKSD